MAKSYCRYHHRAPATWNCPDCGLLLCKDCFPVTPDPRNPQKCALCKGRLNFLGSANTAKPFWMVMPRFFLYPFQPNALLFIALVTAVSAIVPLNLIGLAIYILLFAMVIRYCLQVIERQSEGIRTPPAISDVIGGEGALVLKLLGIYVVLGTVIGLFASLGLLAVIAGFLLMYIMLPAAVMMLATTGSFLQAINPMGLLHLMAKMGWTYAAMVVVTGLISSGPNIVINVLFAPGPDGAVEANVAMQCVAVASLIYFTMVTYAIMGYTLFQHQGDLGFVAIADDEEADAADAKTLALAEIDILMREGRYDEAKASLQIAVADHSADVDVQERYHRYLVNTKDGDNLRKQTPKLLGVLAEQQNVVKATDVYLATVGVDKTFKLDKPNFRHRIAEELFRRRQFKHALALLVNLHKDAPRYNELPAAYFLAAKAYSEGLHDDRRALQLLDFLRQKFPSHPLLGEINQYRSVLAALKPSS